MSATFDAESAHMDLKTFLKETLIQIAEGVHEAKVGTDKAQVAGGLPRFVPDLDMLKKQGFFPVSDGLMQMVEFDVAVSATEEGKADGGISVLGIKAGGDYRASEGSVSRVKFAVPLTLTMG